MLPKSNTEPAQMILATVKLANPGSPGKMSVKMERERERE